MFKLYFFLSNFFINIVIFILFILIGGIYPLMERKSLSLTQRRVGPKFVGYKGRLQFIADSLKLLLKNYLFIKDTNRVFFIFLPIFFLNINLYFLTNITWLGNIKVTNLEYNLVLINILVMINTFIVLLTGIMSKNSYTNIASSRHINMVFITELFLTTFMLFLVLNKGSFSLDFLIKKKTNENLIYLPLFPIFFLFFLLENGKTPFDIVEAETEVIMGYHVEYCGFLFGIFVLGEYLHVFFFSYIICIFFL